MTAGYMDIVRHYEHCLAEHGTGANAVDWNSPESAARRYRVMLGLLPQTANLVTLLDFGCGLADMKEHIDREGLTHIRYEGLDISPEFVEAARRGFPDVTIHCADLLDETADASIPSFDYVIMNGIFTRRETLSHDEMLDYAEKLLTRVAAHARVGLAFNVMSDCVDWKSEQLFHPSFDELVGLVMRVMSRHFTVRNDYGLYESTVYAYREPKV